MLLRLASNASSGGSPGNFTSLRVLNERDVATSPLFYTAVHWSTHCHEPALVPRLLTHDALPDSSAVYCGPCVPGSRCTSITDCMLREVLAVM